jgi:citrate synthase
VVASTGSDLRSCLTAGIGALKGPLHGGAPGPVLDMLDAVTSSPSTNARAWVDAALQKGERIMGMGHRIYRVRDPRAEVLEHALEALAPHLHGNTLARLALARDVEQAATDALAARHPDRPLKANVEFYTAVLLEALGLPRTVFTSTFACARVIGWCAHVAEQRATGRLIRPASRYIGDAPKAA